MFVFFLRKKLWDYPDIVGESGENVVDISAPSFTVTKNSPLMTISVFVIVMMMIMILSLLLLLLDYYF
jgi:hypothetical protein